MSKTQKTSEAASRDGSRSPEGDYSGSDSSYKPDHKDHSDSEDDDQSRKRKIKTLKPMMKVEDALKQYIQTKEASRFGKVRVYERRSKHSFDTSTTAKKQHPGPRSRQEVKPKKMKSPPKSTLIVEKEEFEKLRQDVEGAKVLIRALNNTLSKIVATKTIQTPQQSLHEKTRDPEHQKTFGRSSCGSNTSIADIDWNSASHRECTTNPYNITLNGVARMTHKHKGLDSLISTLKRRLESSGHSRFERSSTPNLQEVHQTCQDGEPLLFEINPTRQHSANMKREPNLNVSIDQLSSSTSKILNAIENMGTPKSYHEMDTSCISKKDAILEDFRSDEDESSSPKTPFKKRKLPAPDTSNKRDDQLKKPRQINTSNEHNITPQENIAPDENFNEMVPIGMGRTFVPRRTYEQIDWKCYTIATRKLLMSVFSRSVLATHSLTGKPSPAFVNKPPKPLLDLQKVGDIVLTVAKKCKVSERLVRSAITTKCADECKLQRLQAAKETRRKNTTLDN